MKRPGSLLIINILLLILCIALCVMIGKTNEQIAGVDNVIKEDISELGREQYEILYQIGRAAAGEEIELPDPEQLDWNYYSDESADIPEDVLNALKKSF